MKITKINIGNFFLLFKHLLVSIFNFRFSSVRFKNHVGNRLLEALIKDKILLK